MKQILRVSILGAKTATVEGKTFTSVYVCQPTDPEDANSAGMHVMKLSADPGMYPDLKKILVQGCPADVNLHTVMKPAAQGAMKMQAVGVELVALTKPAAPAAGAKPSA